MQAQDDWSPHQWTMQCQGRQHVQVKNIAVPESQLKKKTNSIACCCIREQAVAVTVTNDHEPADSNVTDMLTKPNRAPCGLTWLCLCCADNF